MEVVGLTRTLGDAAFPALWQSGIIPGLRCSQQALRGSSEDLRLLFPLLSLKGLCSFQSNYLVVSKNCHKLVWDDYHEALRNTRHLVVHGKVLDTELLPQSKLCLLVQQLEGKFDPDSLPSDSLDRLLKGPLVLHENRSTSGIVQVDVALHVLHVFSILRVCCLDVCLTRRKRHHSQTVIICHLRDIGTEFLKNFLQSERSQGDRICLVWPDRLCEFPDAFRNGIVCGCTLQDGASGLVATCDIVSLVRTT
mmetsp:Transcript_35283/g.53032  ORF Transcript_35283/g.53032 Transcript_35283/m.53032 type:complete len:251 (-) Transcript_35283:231-983(-)